MRRSCVLTLRIVVLAALSAATAASSSTRRHGAAAPDQTYLINCRGHRQYKPRRITVFCADAGMIVKRIHWSSWQGRRAYGRSRRAYANDCNPDCASGHFHRYRVRLKLFRVRYCPTQAVGIFTRMRVRFVGRKWQGPRRFTQRTPCPRG